MTIPPIVRQIVVPASAHVAYTAWTQQIGQWWPLERHSVFEHDNSPTRGARGEAPTVAFVDDEIVETSSTGETTTWGTVLAAEPPGNLTFTWHPGHGPERASTVAVDFVPIADNRTLVRLTHTGWEVFAEPAAAREEYRSGWVGVLSCYRGALPDSATEDQDVWLILESTPGLAAEESVFAHPLFAEHLVFIDKLKADGVLVAAGPLPDSSGHGQTIIRVPASEAARYVEAAHDDLAVAGDLLVLRVRPWHVMVPDH
jgi:uncharacterized protein YciI/uncharacterized protein YndB with AHSA1/START domain